MCDRLKQGLKTLGVLDAMTLFPQHFVKLMCHVTSVLTADDMTVLFHAELSAPGSIKRAKENDVYGWFLDMLQEIEGNLVWHAHALTCTDVMQKRTGICKISFK